MYARKSAQVSATQCTGVPARLIEWNAVGENPPNDSANAHSLSGRVCGDAECGSTPALLVARHAEELSVVVDRIAVDNDSCGCPIRDERARTCKTKLLRAGQQHTNIFFGTNSLQRKKDG